jgi:hypothetical protein
VQGPDFIGPPLYIHTYIPFQTYFTISDILSSFVAALKTASLNSLGMKVANSPSAGHERSADICSDGTLQ